MVYLLIDFQVLRPSGLSALAQPSSFSFLSWIFSSLRLLALLSFLFLALSGDSWLLLLLLELELELSDSLSSESLSEVADFFFFCFFCFFSFFPFFLFFLFFLGPMSSPDELSLLLGLSSLPPSLLLFSVSVLLSDWLSLAFFDVLRFFFCFLSFFFFCSLCRLFCDLKTGRRYIVTIGSLISLNCEG
jgi:hypothetical protein